MKIFYKNKAIIDKAKLLKSGFCQAIGLRFFRPLKKNEALIFELKKKSKVIVDMLFVFYKIDIVWLNENKKIVYIKKNAMPFCFYLPNKNATYIIELRSGTIGEKKIKLGDKLDF